MAKSLAYYVDQLEAAAGGRVDERTDPVEAVNDAGQYLVAMHDWRWLERPPASLDFVSAQQYVALPTDFGQIISISVPNSLQTTVEQTTLEQIVYLRGSSLNDPFRYYVAPVFPTQTDDETIAGNPRLEIWPTPGSNESGALILNYRAGWVALSGTMDKVPNIPLDMEPLLVSIVRAFGRAAGDRKIMIDDLLGRIKEGPIFKAAAGSYGTLQSSLGLMAGGAVQTGRGHPFTYRPHRTITKL